MDGATVTRASAAGTHVSCGRGTCGRDQAMRIALGTLGTEVFVIIPLPTRAISELPG
jgi:hypothetical protein